MGKGMAEGMSVEQALALWRQVTVDSVRGDGPDLSSRQMAVLLVVYLDPPPHTVRGLAGLLKIAKPAVTRALDRLQDLGLIRRHADPHDRRSIHLGRTVAGAVYLRDMAERIAAARGGQGRV